MPSSNVLSEYLDRESLAKQLGKTVRTIARWENLRIGPPVTKVGKNPLYHVDSVREWLRSRERKPVKQRKAI